MNKFGHVQLNDDVMNGLTCAYLQLCYDLKTKKNDNYFDLRDFYPLIKGIVKEFCQILEKISNFDINTIHLPPLYASHFVIYSLAIKLLHAPATDDEIDFAIQLIHYYCKTAPLVYDPSIELFSLHAHLHLPT
ncbi:unnamed protein product [Didymodactylos carnosus]|uniref:Uncharacterized protein n=1 Tax=Didymodactylos carnosus TaxID=1234261 RepID=A0A815KS21_9BILA|nr:unnamed protein product [Didymodactylos carnosus]CAF4291181.1 unnamed protein product [Didymodactylos carnosus]